MAVCAGQPTTAGVEAAARDDNSNLLDALMSEFDRKKSFSGQLEEDTKLDENSNQAQGDDLIPRDAEAPGAAEFAVYCKNLGRPRSPPPKPKRSKSRNTTGSTDSAVDRPSSISSELQEIIESAFGNERTDAVANGASPYRLEMPMKKQQPATPYPTPEHDLNAPDFDERCRGGSSPRTDVPVFREGSVTPGRSASNDSIAFIDDDDAASFGDERYDTIARKSPDHIALDSISYTSALSDSMDWTAEDFAGFNPETASIASLTLTPSTSPVTCGAKDAKTRRKELLRKQISKAVAQKEKMGALFDVAAGNASDQLKKIKRIKSVRFPGAKSRHGKAKIATQQKSLDSNGQLTDGEDANSKPKLAPLPEEHRVKPVYGSTPGAPNGRQMATKSGYLKKQGGKIKTWNERWFVLRGDQLQYYKEMDGKYIASIFLPGNRVATHAIRPNDANKYVFEIFPGNDGQKMSSNHESYLLSANTQTDMEDWVKAIRRVILSPFGGGIFGQRLDETLRYDRRLDSSGCGTTSTGGRSAKSGDSERRQAPIIVENCVEFIRNHGGLKEEGLFRLPGHANEVKDLQDAYDMGERPVFPSNTDVHTVASLLKGYLRELPEPIIPYDRYETLISCAKTSLADGSEAGSDAADARKQEEKRVMKDQLNLLPQANFDLLRYMCRFLDEVQRHSDVNKMDISNLAMVFGPNIMRSKRDDPHTMMSDANLVQHVMFQFIDNHTFFFPDDEKTTPVSSLHSLPDVAMDAAGAVSAPDAGIGTLTSNAASPPGTLTQNRHTDDSGTGSMGPTPESTSKRAPPIPILPPPIRGKPNKPLRRKTSGQGLTPSRNGSTAGDQAPAQRKSLYDNVTASSNASSDVAPPSHYLSHKHDWRSSNESGGGGDLTPRTRSTSAVTTGTAAESYYVNNHSTPSLSSATPRSSTNAVAGSLGEAESLHSSPNDYQPSSRGVPPPKRRTSRKMRRDKSGCATDEESNTESVPPDDRAFSTLSSKRSSFQNDQDHRLDLKSAPSSGKVARPELTAAINRLSMDSVSDEASSASSAAPPVPSRPHRKNKKAGSGQNTGSERNSRSETEMTNDVHQVASNRSSQLPSSTANSVFGSALTYKELEEQVKVLQEELRKQRLEHEKRSRMLEEHYIMKMKSSTSMYSPFSASLPGYPNPHSPTSVTGSEVFSRTGMLDDSATDSGDGVGPTSPVSGRQSVDSQTDLRYKEEVKRHAMTKIRLRNAERGLQQAEERNKQLQKEMEEFFHTFGSMMNAEQPTSY